MQFQRQRPGDGVGIGVSDKQCDLEKQHADDPGGGAAAEPRQNVFRHHRLNLKQEEAG